MILIEVDAGGFQFQALANDREQGAELLTAAWEEHCKEHPESFSDIELAHDYEGPRITDLCCGMVLRDGECLYSDPAMRQTIEVAVLENPGGTSVYLADPGHGILEQELTDYAEENWEEEMCDPREDVPKDEQMEQFFDDGPSYLNMWPDIQWLTPKLMFDNKEQQA